MKTDYRRIAERRNNTKVARVAVARKILTLVYYGLRDGQIRPTIRVGYADTLDTKRSFRNDTNETGVVYVVASARARIRSARPRMAGSTMSPDGSRPTPPKAVMSSTSVAQAMSSADGRNAAAMTGSCDG